jgi:hypothetical protein
VPIRSQCAGDYLFSKGAAKKSEDEFQTIEDGYAASVAKIWSGGDPTVFEYYALIVGVLDLYARNIVHENRTGGDGAHAYHLRTLSLLNALIVGNRSGTALPQPELYALLKTHWGVRLLFTPADREIATSDHPVLCFNWGEGDAIDFLLTPVTPKACAAVFDKRTTKIFGHLLNETDGTNLFRLLATHAHSCLYTSSPPVQGSIDAFRGLWKQRANPRTITEAEKWSLDLIVPPRRDVFSFIRPQGEG